MENHNQNTNYIEQRNTISTCKRKDTTDDSKRKNQVGGRRMEWESNEREILIERTTMELGRNLELGKYPKIHKNDLSQEPKQ